MFRRIWDIAVRIVWVISFALIAMAAVELLRLYVLLRDLHAGAAAGYLFIVGVVSVSLVVWLLHQWLSFPTVLSPPELPENIAEASHRQLTSYTRYLIRYLRRLSGNPSLSPEQAAAAEQQMALLQDTLRSHPLRDDLIRDTRTAEEQAIRPLLAVLNGLAAHEVRRSVRDVMLGVTLSPYHSLDAAGVLYRNGSMVVRIARIYNARPLHREQWMILRDTLRTVAAVNLLNLGKTLFDKLFSGIPFVGRVMDDIAQGIGAGLLTSVAGRAAMDRCAAYRGWTRARAAESITAHAGNFFTDVKDMFTKDVLPSLRPRIMVTAPQAAGEPDFWKRLNDGITGAVDSSAKAVGDYLLKPAVAGTIGVARFTAEGSYHTIRGTGRGVKKLFAWFVPGHKDTKKNEKNV